MCSRCGAKKLFWERGYVHKTPASPRICYWCWHLHPAAATLCSSLLGFSAAELFVSLPRHLSLPSVSLCVYLHLSVSLSVCLSLSLVLCVYMPVSLCRSLYPVLSSTLFSFPRQPLCRDPAALRWLWNVAPWLYLAIKNPSPSVPDSQSQSAEARKALGGVGVSWPSYAHQLCSSPATVSVTHPGVKPWVSSFFSFIFTSGFQP